MRISTAIFSAVLLTPGFIVAQTSAPSAELSDHEKLVAQQKLLDQQQQQIQALQAAMAEQRKMLEGMISGAVNPTAASMEKSVEGLKRSVDDVKAESQPGAQPVSPEVQQATLALKQEQKEQPFVKEQKQWFNKYSLRGYMQMRENNLVNTNGLYKCDQCDKSIGPGNTFFLRRMRLVLSGNVSDHVSVYIQPDFASASGTSLNYAQLRDAYFDVTLDPEKTSRLRFGQSKIPYGFEELQSSQNRLDFDRSDALNSAFPNERDLGIFYYWAPAYIRRRFNELVSLGLKGSGDYGEFGTGFFNGQLPNTLEANNDFHYVARYTYPFKLHNGQFIETSIQGYTGKYKVTSLSSSTTTKPGANYDDGRIAVSLIIYPQPFGFQTEYNWGTGPEYNPATKYIDQKPLNGGYALVNYKWNVSRSVVIFPYARFQYYDGGKKSELDARYYLIREGEVGIETQFGKYIEPTLQYQIGSRIFEDGAKPMNNQNGSLLRLQLQFNY